MSQETSNATMDALPGEIQDIIVSNLYNLDLMNFRLVSKKLSASATRQLFSYIIVTGWQSSQNKFSSILNSPELSEFVTKLTFDTDHVAVGEDFEAVAVLPEITEDEVRNQERKERLERFKDVIRSISSLSNVREVTTRFDYEVAVQRDGSYVAPKEDVGFRTEILSTLFASLQDVKHLQSLSFKNIQNLNNQVLVSSPEFLAALSRITELRMKIAIEDPEGSTQAPWRIPELHDFFSELPIVWLKPASNNLTSLTLHCSNQASSSHWGYVPKCHFRGLHFPKLKKLELGHYVFTRDWQLDWILSHGETLEELLLDTAAIISYGHGSGSVDAENYPSNPRDDSFLASHSWEYTRKWSYFFSQFEKHLPRLKVFQFGVGDWYVPCDSAIFDGAPWMEVGLYGVEYMAFNRGADGPSPWQPLDEFIMDAQNEGFFEPGHRLEDPSEEAYREDKMAYNKLMAVVNSRV